MSAADEITLRLAESRDESALWLMLTFAASMGDGGPDRIDEAKSDPYLRSYVEDWGRRADDLGVVAIDRIGTAIGAAWLRRFSGGPSLNVGEAMEPELSIGVLPEFRARGIGGRLLDALLSTSRFRFQSVALSVRAENPAVRLYRRIGFKEVGRTENRVGGSSLVMRYEVGEGPNGS